MKFSIITVNYNNPKGLERTIKSVLCQTSKEYEYIIVDGASTKGDVEVIRKYESGISKWVSEKDTGIYNAMNKGVQMASGEYCLFMNSGDELFSPTMLDDVLAQNISADFVQGVIVRPGKNKLFLSAPKVEELTLGWYFWQNNNYHQASFIKREMLLKHPYDEAYRISADLKFNVECIIKYACSYQDIDVPIALYEYGGLSTTAKHEKEYRQLFVDLFGERVVKDYESLAYTHRFPINRFMPILKKIGDSSIMLNLRASLRKGK